MRGEALGYAFIQQAFIRAAVIIVKVFHRNAYRHSSLLTPGSSLNPPEVKR
jgi:hypothetical protein